MFYLVSKIESSWVKSITKVVNRETFYLWPIKFSLCAKVIIRKSQILLLCGQLLEMTFV